MKKFVLYLIRWQLSTPILAIVVSALSSQNYWISTMVANFIGACIFFWVDRWIFKSPNIPLWEIKKHGVCHDCGRVGKVQRLVVTKEYNKIKDKNPEFRCESCSEKKLIELFSRGVKID